MDFQEMREAYLRALSFEEQPTYEELRKAYDDTKAELDALKHKHNRVLTALQDSVDAVLRIAREGKSNT